MYMNEIIGNMPSIISVKYTGNGNNCDIFHPGQLFGNQQFLSLYFIPRDREINLYSSFKHYHQVVSSQEGNISMKKIALT